MPLDHPTQCILWAPPSIPHGEGLQTCTVSATAVSIHELRKCKQGKPTVTPSRLSRPCPRDAPGEGGRPGRVLSRGYITLAPAHPSLSPSMERQKTGNDCHGCGMISTETALAPRCSQLFPLPQPGGRLPPSLLSPVLLPSPHMTWAFGFSAPGCWPHSSALSEPRRPGLQLRLLHAFSPIPSPMSQAF